MKKGKSKKQKHFEEINPNAAGIDIGSRKHYVSVSKEKAEKPIREFGTTTKELEELVTWLKTLGIETVAMESTGIYWISLYDMLEANKIEVYLVNAKNTKNVSGRKSDVSDCEWIRQLHSYGLLNRSFIPAEKIREFRTYVRQREKITTEKATDLLLIRKVLDIMNIKLGNLVSDLEGETAMKVIRNIASGISSPEELVKHWNKQMKASYGETLLALQGNYKQENIFLLVQALNTYDFHKSQMRECEQKIEEVLQAMSAVSEHKDKTNNTNSKKDKKKRKPRKNDYNFDASDYLRMITGVDLTAIDGFGENSIITIIAETGLDMSRFKTSKHFVSWLKLCPNPKISGGVIIGYNKNTSSNRASKAFRMCAYSLHSSKSWLGQYYRRIAYKRGSAVAIKAVARKLAVIFYTMLKNGTEYVEQDIKQYQERNHKKMIRNLERKAKSMGYKLEKLVS